MALAAFILGGAACGKTSVIRDRYIEIQDVFPQGDPNAEPPREGFATERHYDADAYKKRIAMYSPALDDEELLLFCWPIREYGARGSRIATAFRRLGSEERNGEGITPRDDVERAGALGKAERSIRSRTRPPGPACTRIPPARIVRGRCARETQESSPLGYYRAVQGALSKVR